MSVTKVMAASLTDERNRQMKAEVIQIAVTSVAEGERQRPIDPKVVSEIYRSIEQVGLLQPISVKHTPPGTVGFALIAGAHRLRAWRQKLDEAMATEDKHQIGRWSDIPAVLYPVDMPVDLVAMVEIQENLVRKDLTAEERLALGGKYEEWRLEEEKRQKEAAEGDRAKNDNSLDRAKKDLSTKAKQGRPVSWFATWYEGAKIPKETAREIWDRFLTETGRPKITPGSKDGTKLRAVFAAWAKAAKAKPAERVEAAAAAQEAERVRETARKIELLKTGIAKDFGELHGLVGSSAAAAFALELHDTAGDAP